MKKKHVVIFCAACLGAMAFFAIPAFAGNQGAGFLDSDGDGVCDRYVASSGSAASDASAISADPALGVNGVSGDEAANGAAVSGEGHCPGFTDSDGNGMCDNRETDQCGGCGRGQGQGQGQGQCNGCGQGQEQGNCYRAQHGNGACDGTGCPNRID